MALLSLVAFGRRQLTNQDGRHKKTGALAGAPVFSIIGPETYSASLIIHFFL